MKDAKYIEAEDTVMASEIRKQFQDIESMLRVQARISFSAGIKKASKWIEDYPREKCGWLGELKDN